jgi:hypothetical protein
MLICWLVRSLLCNMYSPCYQKCETYCQSHSDSWTQSHVSHFHIIDCTWPLFMLPVKTIIPHQKCLTILLRKVMQQFSFLPDLNSCSRVGVEHFTLYVNGKKFFMAQLSHIQDLRIYPALCFQFLQFLSEPS